MKSTLLAALLAIGAVGSASAATLDFSGVTNPVGAVVTLPNATLTGYDNDVGVANVNISLGGGFCFRNAAVGCAGSGQIDFANQITNLVFTMVGLQNNEKVTISGYLNGVLVGSKVFEDSHPILSTVDLASFGALDQLVFIDESVAYTTGASFRDFSFTEVPLPAAAPMLLAGIGGLTLLRRRRRAV